MGELAPEVKAEIDSAIAPFLAIFSSEMTKKRAGGFDEEDIEEFVRDAVESYEEHTNAPLDPLAGPYVVAKLREVAGLPPAKPEAA